MQLIGVILSCGWIGFGLTALAQDQGTLIRSELKGSVWKGSLAAPEDPLNDMKVFIELDTVQPDVPKGIVFFVDIVNGHSEPIEFLAPGRQITIQRKGVHPTHRTAIALRRAEDLHRGRVSVSLPALRRLICTGDPEGFMRRWEKRKPFNITEAPIEERQAGEKSIGDVKNGEIRLEPGEHFQYYVRITKIMGDPERYWAQKEKHYDFLNSLPRGVTEPPDERVPPVEPPQIIPIPPGDYTLTVSVSLRSAEQPIETAARSHRLSGPIPVHLGPK